MLPGDASGIFEDEVNVTDVGSLSREARGPFGIDYAKITFWEFFFGVDDVKAWDVDLGEFLNDIEEDPDAATMLGTANDFDLDAEGSSTDDPSQSADLASSQAGDTSGIIDERLFDDERSIKQI